ncbi:hypothetical protein FXO37_29073 [Capsicum annuum]|nr:hypothetical protein FXO37_29073 [Capsicum annuum]
MALHNDSGDKTREVLADAQAHIWNHTFNFINSMSLKCAIQLGIPDIIHSHGRPMTLSDLVNALPINNNNAKIQDYEPNLSMIPFVQAMLDPILMDPWHNLSQWIQIGGDDKPTLFAIAHYKPLYEYAGDDAKFNCLFNEAMASDSLLIISVMIEHCKGDFEGLKSLVDVGGGTGTMAKVISNEFPELKCGSSTRS